MNKSDKAAKQLPNLAPVTEKEFAMLGICLESWQQFCVFTLMLTDAQFIFADQSSSTYLHIAR